MMRSLFAAIGTAALIASAAAREPAGTTNVIGENQRTVSSANRLAAVNANGTLARGYGVVSTARLGVGRYEVITTKNVSKCFFLATIGSAGTNVPTAYGRVRTALRAGNSHGVFVRTTNSLGDPSDRPFHLAIMCGLPTEDRAAAVNNEGSLVRGVGIVSTGLLNSDGGEYEVITDRSMSRCFYVATVGDGGISTSSFDGVITTALLEENSEGVYVRSAGVGPQPFHLYGACPRLVASPRDVPARAPPPPRSDRFAVVNPAGTPARGYGVVSTKRILAGRYEVITNRDVTRCSFIATIGRPGIQGSLVGAIHTALRFGNNKGVFIATRNNSGDYEDRGFHLFVACPR